MITPLFVHFPLTRDALMAGKHVFCEKCLVFKPEEVHALRALALEHPKQTLQTGLQRRYSYFYQTVKQMVDKGILGDVHHMHAQWHRNMINKPSSLWTMKPGGEKNIANWRVYRSMSGGLTAELTSHQVDVADWMFGSGPEFVIGFGSLDVLKDGRDVYDNVQLVYRYPKGRQLTYSSISTNQFLPYFNGSRAQMGECIMGTDGTWRSRWVRRPACIAWWYREPPKTTPTDTRAHRRIVVLRRSARNVFSPLCEGEARGMPGLKIRWNWRRPRRLPLTPPFVKGGTGCIENGGRLKRGNRGFSAMPACGADRSSSGLRCPSSKPMGLNMKYCWVNHFALAWYPSFVKMLSGTSFTRA